MKNIQFKVNITDDDMVDLISSDDIDDVVTQSPLRGATEIGTDRLTGLSKRDSFVRNLAMHLGQNPDTPGGVIYFDIQRFTLLNNLFGMDEGDKVLRYVGNLVTKYADPQHLGCHVGADRFIFYTSGTRNEVAFKVQSLFNKIAKYDLPFAIKCNAGIFAVEGSPVHVTDSIDGAVLAQKNARGDAFNSISFYDDLTKNKLYEEQRFISKMRDALENDEFILHYQPQFSHSTGRIIGAEALVRWDSPEEGLIYPNRFIHLFETTGFIVDLDRHIFEKVCDYLRRLLDQGINPPPISVNLTRHDIFSPGFLNIMEYIRKKYNIPPRLIHLEITESSVHGNADFINDILDELHSIGYIVEMDDFGSGYSSLNILKDINFDLVKLDTRFFEDKESLSGRGGVILSSIVRMIKWLRLPIIAEGVEHLEQADYLQSIGCDFIQGYLYSKPIPEDQLTSLLESRPISHIDLGMKFMDNTNINNFWSSNSIETLLFSDYVGGALVFEYDMKKDTIDILRVNKKLLRELGMNITEADLIGRNVHKSVEKTSLDEIHRTINTIIDTGEETECEIWCTIESPCCGQERVCLRLSISILADDNGRYICYALVRNITAEKIRINRIMDTERRFNSASEQANIYYWEYDVATHDMRPCFRCMRDLGLPALVHNYPEYAISVGIFPEDVADEYREWHRLIDAGEADTLEAIMPLTVGRVPFHVRYTTVYDESGAPVKAYGSATLVVD